ncbi:putative sodium-coupled neutral amino acid transporter 10 [Actinia tenebrosa]|uniref:Sodium-coupled neutral amino acid transporter 10 n=1 Tax=Actinia tenebrosa TaxID=6105 RepID=A0A6P8IU48_ACTTE|nr:putative sodium-coupled neutral amino acid transporter 10 [Actinia tenebrosa]
MAPHRPTLFNLMNSIIGVSVLSIPYCFHQCGILLGPLAMITMGYFTRKTCYFLLISSQLGRRRSYESLAQFTYGNAGKFAVEACIIGVMAGTLCAFHVIIGDLAPDLFSHLFGIQQTPTLRALLMIVLALCIGLPLSLMRDISSLSSISATSLGFYATFVLYVMFSSLPHLLEGTWTKHLNFWRPAGLLQCLPIFSLAFSCQTQLFGLYDSLPEPSVKKMENVVSVGIKIISCVYLCVGLFGYVTFYDVGVQGDILTNYGSGSLGKFLKMGFVMSVLVSIPLMVFPMRASINSLLFRSQTAGTENMPGGPGYMPQNRFVIITVVVICATLNVGIFIPQIEFVLGITGATIGTLIILVLPASMYLNAIQDTQGEQKNMAKFTIVFGLICLVASTYSVLSVNNHSHHESSHPLPSTIKPAILVNTLPNTSDPVVGPIQAVKANGVKADVGLRNKEVKEANPTQKPAESKTEKPSEGKRKIEEIREKAAQRKEPALPHPPADKPAEGPIKKNEKEADPVNEKRQLMSTDDANQSPADTQEDKDLSSKLDVPQKSALKAPISKTESTNQDIEKKIKNLREKKAQVESDLKSLQELKKPENRERRDLEKKRDGKEESTVVDPTDKEIPAHTVPPNDTNIRIVGPNSSSMPLLNPTTIGKTPAEVTNPAIVANVSGEVAKGRELKSNGVVGRTLKSEDKLVNNNDSKVGNTGGYRNLWGTRLARRANRLRKTGFS